MIKNVLLPESWKGYYLFSKRIVGFYVEAHHVWATQVYLKGDKITVENVFHEIITSQEGVTHEESVSKAVSAILDRVGKYDVIHTMLPSSQVIFKTLRLPFLDYEQIKMVVHFEVEPLLPFSLDQAIIDFIVTKQFPEEKSSEIIVAAIQTSVVAEHFSYFDHVKGGPKSIGIDLFGLYALYQKIPTYVVLEGGVALLDIGVHSTRVAFINNGQLKAVRVLGQGSDDFLTRVSVAVNKTYDEVKDMAMTQGVTGQGDQAFHEALTRELQAFLSNVQFTLGSFAVGQVPQPIIRFIVSGSGAHITGLHEFVTHSTGIACEYFQISQLFANKKCELKTGRMIDLAYLISLSAALPAGITHDFNLLPSDVLAARETHLLTQQVSVALVFICTLFVSLFVHNFLQERMLRHEITASQDEVVEVMRKTVDIPADEQDFDEIVSLAQKAVNKEENMWFPFSAQSQFLRALLELHTLDKEGLGLEIERLMVTKDSMTLKAKVKDFNAVIALEQELRKSKLFRYEDTIQKTDFAVKIGLTRI
jgi:Tfp pilus assembly PilM family ATPase